MPRVLGIIGGGQLGMMLAEAAASMPGEVSRVVVLDPTEGCPAAQAGAEQIVAGYRDAGAIAELARRADVLTYEIESGDADVLESVSGDVEISPPPGTLRTIQDKLLQKELLRDCGIPVPEFAPAGGPGDVAEALGRFGYPAMLKARRDGYDGRGNRVIRGPGDVEAACRYFGGRPMMLERFVPFEMEVSVIAARDTAGGIAAYPLVENVHEESILRQTVAPARVAAGVAEEAGRVAGRVMGVLRGAGVFGIEMFVAGGRVMVNEIAPRVHNSGHHTLQSSETSQFEQHLRAILGLDLGGTGLLHCAVMYNILGGRDFEGPYLPPDLQGGDLHLKMYGKAVSKPLRKLGHLNIVGRGGETVGQLLGRLDELRASASVRPA